MSSVVDVETNQRQQSGAPVPNPYQSQQQQQDGAVFGVLPPNHPVHKLKRVFYMAASGYGLHHFKFFKTIIKSPHIRHFWFQVGLACTIAILTVKAYIETFEGRMQRRQITYKNYPQTTHSIIALILFATFAFNVALWPHYGWNTPILLGTCFFGLILQFLLIVPTYIQNIVGLIILAVFMQEYSGTGIGMLQPYY